MKIVYYSLSIAAVTVLSVLSSCSKRNTPSPRSNNSQNTVKKIVTQSMTDSLTAAGATIYQGSTPPTISGIFLMSPDSCVYDNSPSHSAGQLFDDYKFQFSNQNNTNFTITVAQKNFTTGVQNPAPAATYITGSGNNFSIYMLSTSTPSGVSVQKFNVLSGTLTSNGIKNLQNTFYLRSKGSDPTNTVVPAGTIRIFVTGASGIATVSPTF